MKRVNLEGTSNVENHILCTIPVTVPFYNPNSKSNLRFLMLEANNAKKHFLKVIKLDITYSFTLKLSSITIRSINKSCRGDAA